MPEIPFYVQGLLLTLLIEVPLALFLVRPKPWPGIPLLILFNGLTHPLANLLMLHGPLDFQIQVGIAELLVVLVEALLFVLFFRLNARRAIAISVACNAASFLLGLLVFS